MENGFEVGGAEWKQLLRALSWGAIKMPCLNRIDSGFTVFILSSQGGLCRRERNPDVYLLMKFHAPLLY